MGYSGDCCEDSENTKKGKVPTEISITAYVCMVINNAFPLRLDSYFRDGLAKENRTSNPTFLRRGSQGVGMTVDNKVCSNGRRFKFCGRRGGGHMTVDSFLFFFRKDRFELIQQNLHCDKLKHTVQR